MAAIRQGAYSADDDIVDFILGITFEIWEQGGVELIYKYYAPESIIYCLDGIVNGSAAVVESTRATLAGFPDRLLVAENVIWSGNRADGYYTSHRLMSLATNKGPTAYGPATLQRVRMTNIADCVVENGQVVREWLVRDNMALATQLGAVPIVAAKAMAERRTPDLTEWIASESERLQAVKVPATVDEPVTPRQDPEAFAWRVLNSCWRGERQAFDAAYAPYCVLHRTPWQHYSGRDDVFGYYESLRRVIGDAHFSVDHVASQPYGQSGIEIAVRWTACGEHQGEVMGVAPTGKPMFILGVSHFRCIAGHIASETTVFDDLAVLSQTMV